MKQMEQNVDQASLVQMINDMLAYPENYPQGAVYPMIRALALLEEQQSAVAEGRPDKDALNSAVGLYRELSKKYPHKIAVQKAAESHNLDSVQLNNYIDHGRYSSKQGVAEGKKKQKDDLDDTYNQQGTDDEGRDRKDREDDDTYHQRGTHDKGNKKQGVAEGPR